MRACLKMKKGAAAKGLFERFLFLLALICTLGLARGEDTSAVKTNLVNLRTVGKLEVLTPRDWTMTFTNVSLPDNPVQVEFHAPSNSVVLRIDLRWDGFNGRPGRVAPADMERMVSNNIVVQYLPSLVETNITLEKLTGPDVSGVYARITDAKWSPIRVNDYPNIAEGMFRSRNIVGNFDMLTFGKDGPGFKAGLKVLQSVRRLP